MKNIKHWILAARPKTLTAAIVPIIAASALAKFNGFSLNIQIILCALLSSFCIQIGTNLVNDASDFKKGADTTDRLGPQRVTQMGFFTYKQVMVVASLFFAAAVLLGVPLVIQGGWPIVLIGVLSVIMGYIYTAGKYALAYLGLGDLFVILFFGLIAVGGMYYLLTSAFTVETFVLGLQIGFLSTVLIAINNLRDIHTDALVNKKTLATRLGVQGSKMWIIFLIVAPFLTGYYWLFKGHMYLYIAPMLSLPLGLSVMKKIIRTEPSVAYNKFLAMASLYSLLFSVLFYVGTYF